MVGQITACDRHPGADKLYVSQIDVGGSTLQVCSGLVDYVLEEKMRNLRVVVVSNLKPSKMRGVKSEAMVLAAEKDLSTVRLVTPPENTPLGSNLHFQGFEKIEKPPRLKPLVWAELAASLRTDSEGRVAFGESLLVDEGGQAVVSLLVESSVR